MKYAVLFAMLVCAITQANVNILPTPGKIVPATGFYKVGAGAEIGLDGTFSNHWKITFQPLEKELGDEGYQLEVAESGVTVRSNTEAGKYYALVSLKQLEGLATDGKIPCVNIEDQPKYGWRSFMIDSGRQYQKMDTIKGLLDRMALLKMNVFHWHLSENDGWRVEIKRYPNPTEIGAFIANGLEQHGFYTQDDIREIVAYAAERHIMVVPEIDVPGHSVAALTSYPELTCTGTAPHNYSPYLYCAGRESTYEFLFNVLDELCELFPSPYIHIGGDEAPKKDWKNCDLCQARIKELGLKNEHELQVELTNRLAKHLKSKGRKAICWGDVVTLPGQELEDNVVIHWWNYQRSKDKALREGIRRGMKVIANPNRYTYINFPQKHPWRGYKENRLFDFQTCYEKNPGDIRHPTAGEAKALLGMGTCLWTDHNLTEEWLDRRIFPRAFAMAEQMWSTAQHLPYEEFRARTYARESWLSGMGIGGDWAEEY
ncbi:MAG: beta-N-acetylhexosaminidase [Kiritimatiellales bacterium]|nr:beta-N-acetylhexosaminidase [Kiritimatiellales bacterium]